MRAFLNANGEMEVTVTTRAQEDLFEVWCERGKPVDFFTEVPLPESRYPGGSGMKSARYKVVCRNTSAVVDDFGNIVPVRN